MKRMTIGVAAVLLMAVAAQAHAADKLEGKWRTTSIQDGQAVSLTIEFGASGSYTASAVGPDGADLGTLEGTYGFSAGTLTINYPSGKTESYQVTFLGNDSFIDGADIFLRVE